MVVFTCNHCGESLQKPRVEKHYMTQCRNNFKSLTCVDCHKDFHNEEYAVHIKCVTEEERYAAKGTYIGGIVKKGEVKQESWMDMIKSIVNEEPYLKPSVKNLLQTISGFTNVPRKKPKFINFLKSSMAGRVNFNDIEATWDIIENYKKKQIEIKEASKREETTNGNGQQNGTKRKAEDTEVSCEKKLKTTENESTNEVESVEKFSFKDTILDILKSSTSNSISCKKLQKKFMKIYTKETGNTENLEKTIKKYNKKLQKIQNVTVADGTVTLSC